MILMFSTIGNLLFAQYLKEFKGLFDSCLTMIDAALGNYDIEMFWVIEDSTLVFLAQVYVVSLVLASNILLFNLLVAILANTYNIFDSKSNGLFLSKILSMRD